MPSSSPRRARRAPVVLTAALTVATLLAGCTSSADPPSPSSDRGAAGPSPTPTPTPAAGPSTYVALGDSVAAGVGAATPSGGYVPLLRARLAEQLGCGRSPAPGCPLELADLAVSGATTATLLRDQLPQALRLLEGGADVRLVTVTVGGNDVFGPVLQACAVAPQDPACRTQVAAAVDGVGVAVGRVLDELGAASDGVPVAVMTYYDPLPACRLAPLQPLAEQVLEGVGDQQGLNDALRAAAREHDAVVVETADRLRVPQDFVGGLDCLHPSASGHERIAQAFAEALPPDVLGG